MTRVARCARPLFVVVCFVVMTLSGVGCSSYPPTLVARMDNADRDTQSVEVHLLGVDEAEYQRLMRMRMTEYWSPAGPGRRQASNPNCLILQLDQRAPSHTISKDDPHWQQWKSSSVRHLLVLADLSNVSSSMRDSNQDPRRAHLPLDPGNLKYPSTITITIGRNGVRFDPPLTK